MESWDEIFSGFLIFRNPQKVVYDMQDECTFQTRHSLWSTAKAAYWKNETRQWQHEDFLPENVNEIKYAASYLR